MGDDADSIDPEQKGASIFLVARFLLHGQEGSSREVGTKHPKRISRKLRSQPVHHGLRYALRRLEHHITDEAIADHYVYWIFEEIVAFYVAAEVDFRLREKLERLFCQLVSFDVFRPNAEKPHTRIDDMKHLSRVDAAHDCIPEKVHGIRIDVGA